MSAEQQAAFSLQEFFTPAELREYLRNHYSISTLNAWRSKGIGPKFVRFGGNKVLYRVSAVKEWETQQESQTTIKPRKEGQNGAKRKSTGKRRATKAAGK